MLQAIRKTAITTGVAALAAAPLSAAAQDPVGIAVIWAPEQAVVVATGRNMEQAFADAIVKCVEKGAMAEDCNKTNWCAPAGWTVDVFLQRQEGDHWHEFHCGLPNRTAALATALHVCDPVERNYLVECFAVKLYDPEGTEVEVK